MDRVRKSLLAYYKPRIVPRPGKCTGIFPKEHSEVRGSGDARRCKLVHVYHARARDRSTPTRRLLVVGSVDAPEGDTRGSALGTRGAAGLAHVRTLMSSYAWRAAPSALIRTPAISVVACGARDARRRTSSPRTAKLDAAPRAGPLLTAYLHARARRRHARSRGCHRRSTLRRRGAFLRASHAKVSEVLALATPARSTAAASANERRRARRRRAP